MVDSGGRGELLGAMRRLERRLERDCACGKQHIADCWHFLAGGVELERSVLSSNCDPTAGVDACDGIMQCCRLSDKSFGGCRTGMLNFCSDSEGDAQDCSGVGLERSVLFSNGDLTGGDGCTGIMQCCRLSDTSFGGCRTGMLNLCSDAEGEAQDCTIARYSCPHVCMCTFVLDVSTERAELACKSGFEFSFDFSFILLPLRFRDSANTS